MERVICGSKECKRSIVDFGMRNVKRWEFYCDACGTFRINQETLSMIRYLTLTSEEGFTKEDRDRISKYIRDYNNQYNLEIVLREEHEEKNNQKAFGRICEKDFEILRW